MAISDSSKIDLLYKKLFGVAKTDTPTAKSPNNETIASPPLLRADKLWANASQIPNPTPPSSTSSYVQVYTGTAKIECTADLSSNLISGVPQTWKTSLTDWIPQEFGPNYAIKAYIAPTGTSNPSATGIRIYQDGDSAGGEFFFDYQAGTLNFISGSMPSTFTSTLYSSSNYRVFIEGYRYVGSFGIAASGFTGTLPVANGGTGRTTIPTAVQWVTATTYALGDLVYNLGITYRRITASGVSNNAPASDSPNWAAQTGPSSSYTASTTAVANTVPLRDGAGYLGSENFTGILSVYNGGLAGSIELNPATGVIRAASSVLAYDGNIYADIDGNLAYAPVTGLGNVTAANQIITSSTAVDSIQTSGGITLLNSVGGSAILKAQAIAGLGATYIMPTVAGTLISTGDSSVVADGMLASGVTITGLGNSIVKTSSTGGITARGAITASQIGGVTAGTLTLQAAGGSNTIITPATGSGNTLTLPITTGTLLNDQSTIAVGNGGTGATSNTGTGTVNVLQTSPIIITPFGIQASIGSITGTVTIPQASISARIITTNSASAITVTVPTPATMALIMTGVVNQSMDWSVINIGAGAVTFAANGAHTIVGSLSLASGASASFRTRKTVVDTTFITYRLA